MIVLASLRPTTDNIAIIAPFLEVHVEDAIERNVDIRSIREYGPPKRGLAPKSLSASVLKVFMEGLLYKHDVKCMESLNAPVASL